MRATLAAGLLAVLALGPARAESGPAPLPQPEVPASAEGDAAAPYMFTRSLQALQDQIALGSTAAHEAQRKLLAHIAERFLAADPQLWSEPRNARAAVTYVLSGGQPQIMRTLLELGEAVPVERALMEGALAYAEGREAEAAELLGGIDARALAPGLGGHVALVQATLAMRRDPKKAAALLDVARLLMPGTLVEEAALRRQVFAASETGQLPMFLTLSRQYVQRFQHSVYAGSFTEQFAEALTRLDFEAAPDRLPEIETLLADLSETARRSMYLSIASTALIRGKTQTALFAARKVAASASAGSVEATKAELYEAAAQIVTDDFEAARDRLKALDASRLSKEDAEIRAAALRVAEQLRSWPADAGPAPNPPSDTAPVPAESAEPADQSTPLMDRARELIATSDSLLQRSVP